MLLGDQKTQYALKIDGKTIYQNSQLALVENYKQNLTEDQKNKAQIIPVTSDGSKQILLG